MFNLMHKLCGKLTHHKLRVGTYWSVGIEPQEFHYKCLICGLHFWNHTPHKKYLRSNDNEMDKR